MADDRTIREILSAVETSINFINNHLGNIDQHLNRLNERTADNEKDISRNTESIRNMYLIGGSLLGGGSLIAIILKTLGII